MHEKTSVSNHRPRHDPLALDAFFEHDVEGMLSFSRDTWLPELHTAFQELGAAIRSEEVSVVSSTMHRICGCAAMGGAHDIAGSMNEINDSAKGGHWLMARRQFREARHLLSDLAQWIEREYNHLAS